MTKKPNWATYTLMFGILLFIAAFFMPVLPPDDGTSMFGYDAAWVVLNLTGTESISDILFYLFLNFTNLSVILMFILFFSKSKKWFLVFIPVLGFSGAIYWLFEEFDLEIGYWSWAISQALISAAFIFNLLSKRKKLLTSVPE